MQLARIGAVGLHGLLKNFLGQGPHGQLIPLRLGHLVDQAQIFAAQGQRKTRVIVASKDGRHIVLRHPTVARAGLDGLPHGVQRDAGLGTHHEPLANGSGADKPQQIGQQLDGRAIAVHAHVKYFFTEHVKNGPVSLIHRFIPADKNRQAPQGGKIRRIGHRGLEKIAAPLARQVGELAHQLHRTGGRVDHGHARSQSGHHPGLAQHHRLHLRRAGQGGHDHITCRHPLVQAVGPMRPLGQQVLCFVGRNVIHRQGVTGFEQIGCHWVAHVANANEKDMGQGSH